MTYQEAVEALVAAAPADAPADVTSAIVALMRHSQACPCSEPVTTIAEPVTAAAGAPVMLQSVSTSTNVPSTLRVGEAGPEQLVIRATTEPSLIAAQVRTALAAAAVPTDLADPADPPAIDLATPPDDWFAPLDPALGAIPWTITSSGHAYGYVATWQRGNRPSCHIGLGDCTPPPRSPSNYAHFRQGTTVTASGASIRTGKITFDTGHANLLADASATVRHYDHSGYVGADVAIGENEIGIWVAGAVRPEVMNDPNRLRALRAAALSGDWRPIDGHRELVAALGVNTPGFPIPQTLSLAAAGQEAALVAANIVPQPELWEPVVESLQAQVATLTAAVANLIAKRIG